MAKDFSKKFYSNNIWKQCRASYIAKVNGICERCKTNGHITPGMIVHHINEITPQNINDPSITLNHDNLEYVCMECHNKIHYAKFSSTRKGIQFDEEGNVIAKEETYGERSIYCRKQS